MVNQTLARVLVLSIITLAIGCAQTSSRRVAKPRDLPASHQIDDSTSAVASVYTRKPPQELTSNDIRQIGNEESATLPSPIQESSDELVPPRDIASGSLALADLEALAMSNNPTLSQAAAAVDQQRGEYRQSGLYPNPQVGYLNTTANQSAPKQSNGIFLSQEFVTAQKIPLAQAADSQEIKRLQWDQEAQRMRVLNDVRIRYYEVLGAQRSVAVNRELERVSPRTSASLG